MNHFQKIIVFALNRGPEDYNLLKSVNLDWKHVEGAYKGTIEDSYVVLNTSANLERVLTIAKATGQESILLVDHERYAELFFLKTQTYQGLGYLKEVSKGYAEQYGNYIKTKNAYFVAEGK